MANRLNQNIETFKSFQRPTAIGVDTPLFGQSEQAGQSTALLRERATKKLAELDEQKLRRQQEFEVGQFGQDLGAEQQALIPGQEGRGGFSAMDRALIQQTTGENVIPKVEVSKGFGERNPQDVFSQGINNGTDFKTPTGTPVKLPPGEWDVVEAFNQASREGFIGNNENQGFGNSVTVKNKETGETLRFSHLNKVGVSRGATIPGGQVIALSGNTGNSSGPHLDVEFRNQQGALGDVLQSRYASLFN